MCISIVSDQEQPRTHSAATERGHTIIMTSWSKSLLAVDQERMRSVGDMPWLPQCSKVFFQCFDTVG